MASLRDIARSPYAMLAFVVAAIHGRDVSFGYTSLDDLTLLVDDRPFLASAGAVGRAFGRTYFHVTGGGHPYFRPLVTASYALDVRLHGGTPAGFHLTNVVLHLVATWLVYALLVRTKLSSSLARVVALAFAVHPALVSAVAWIPGRNDVLLAVFALAALLAHARAVASSSGSRVNAWRAAHVAFFLAALFTKETAVIIPLVCVAWSALVASAPSRSRVWSSWGPIIATWLVTLGGFAWARHRALSAAGADVSVAVDGVRAHASVLIASLAKLVVPTGLAPIATLDDASVGWGLAVWGAVVVATAVLRRRGALRGNVIAFGASIYVMAMVPSLFVGGSLVLENRLYLPAVGLAIVLGEWLRVLDAEPRVVFAFSAVVVLALSVLSLGYASAFRDPLAFGKAAVAGAPRSALAHFTLGQARQMRGELDAAIAEYEVTLQLAPDEPIVHNNIAVIHMRRGDWAAAERALAAELRVNPAYSRALENLTVVQRKTAAGRTEN